MTDPKTPEAELALARAEAAYWKQKHDEERVRLAKLWAAYRDLEARAAPPLRQDPV
ncbi:MAG TPA: hypothetical protein VHH36_09180 [Candidatus Thermoplasmatota archaeon]|nr:hypothetical protein [Candidatus Thermoplasmatota archaeon]